MKMPFKVTFEQSITLAFLCYTAVVACAVIAAIL